MKPTAFVTFGLIALTLTAAALLATGLGGPEEIKLVQRSGWAV